MKALKEGAQIPGALKGLATGPGPTAFPAEVKSGRGSLEGNGTGRSGGGSTTGLKGMSSADYNQYFSQLKKRVESVWKYPDGVAGLQKVGVRIHPRLSRQD